MNDNLLMRVWNMVIGSNPWFYASDNTSPCRHDDVKRVYSVPVVNVCCIKYTNESFCHKQTTNHSTIHEECREYSLGCSLERSSSVIGKH